MRQEGDDGEPQPKVVRRGRPPTKHLKKSLGSSPLERVAPETSSEVTLATGGDISISSNSYNLRKAPTPCKFQQAEVSVKAPYGSRSSDNYSGWLSEWNNEFPGMRLKFHELLASSYCVPQFSSPFNFHFPASKEYFSIIPLVCSIYFEGSLHEACEKTF